MTEDSTQQNRIAEKRRRLTVTAYDWVSMLVISLLALVIAFTFFLRIARVDGDSMNATLMDGDQLLLFTAVSQYHRGDIVVVDRYTVEPLIKRVIAVGGDTIRIDEKGHVYLNGLLLIEPYATTYTPQRGCTEEMIIPEGYVFLMGDNRMVSQDSRAQEIGPVLEKDLLGKAVFRLSPLPVFGGIYDNMEQR